jgi:inosine/xanthosine triphosphate pyrophosphatase family protein
MKPIKKKKKTLARMKLEEKRAISHVELLKKLYKENK